MDIEFTFSNLHESKYDTFEEHFYKLAKRVFEHLKLDDNFIFEVDLVDLKTIHQINKEHRNIDRPTDVISFAFEDEVDGETPLKKVKGLPRDLGEIFICVDKAIEQSQTYKHSFLREMSFLFVHGLLHLLGYDHMKKEDEEIMFSLQDEILDPLNL